MTDSTPTDELLARVVAGEASAEEAAMVERWAASDPAHRTVLEALRGGAAPGQGAWEVDAAWRKVSARLHTGERPAAVLPIARPPSRRQMLLRLAAVIVVVVGIALAWQVLRSPAALLEVATAPGERREVSLPDGTLAIVAPDSRLVVPAGFGPEHRIVRLDGEAWFQATHEGHPFEVHSRIFQVRDLGTTFSIEGRRHQFFRVTVVEGAVEVRHRGVERRLALLEQGDVGDFHQDGALLAVHHDQPVESRTAWRTGRLEFVDAPVMDVIERLSAWYAVDIRIAPARTIGRTLTATFPGDSLDSVLELLVTLLGVVALRDDDGGVWLQ